MNAELGGALPQGVTPSQGNLGTTVAEVCSCPQCRVWPAWFGLLRELGMHRDACWEWVRLEGGDR